MSAPAPTDDLVRAYADTLAALHRALGHDRDLAEIAQLLRDVGIERGQALLEHFRDWLSEADGVPVDPAELSAAEFWERLSAFFTELCWGRIEQTEVHSGVISLLALDWIESRTGRSPQPRCHFTT